MTIEDQRYTEGTAAIAVVHEQLRNVSVTLSDIKEVLKNQGDQLAKLAVIEERNSAMAATIGRAFTQIEELKVSAAQRGTLNDAAHASARADLEQHKTKTNRWIYMMSGAMTAVTIMWGVFGAYFSDTVKAAIEVTHAYRYQKQMPPGTEIPAPRALEPR